MGLAALLLFVQALQACHVLGLFVRIDISARAPPQL